MLDAYRQLLDLPVDIGLRQAAAQALSSAMANESAAWDHHDIERIDHILMSLEEPCPHALWSLEELATARAMRPGLRLDAILQEALLPHREKIDLVFVFGSTAHKRQQSESDVDLFIIGSVTQKELAGDLSDAERVLGCRINAVINSASEFARKWKAWDPFVLEMSGGPKLPILDAREADTAGGLDDELRAMATMGLGSSA